jgi:hypothetical protein
MSNLMVELELDQPNNYNLTTTSNLMTITHDIVYITLTFLKDHIWFDYI